MTHACLANQQPYDQITPMALPPSFYMSPARISAWMKAVQSDQEFNHVYFSRIGKSEIGMQRASRLKGDKMCIPL